ncbi:22308_t:CDS:1, partial [Dentiscutata erythropus]
SLEIDVTLQIPATIEFSPILIFLIQLISDRRLGLKISSILLSSE